MEITILKDIVVIFALSTLVNLVFSRRKIPTVMGYIVTGIIAGPYMLSLVDAREQLTIIADIGVALLLFTIGMEFSMKHLLRIRRIVFLGGFMQVFLTAGIFMLVSGVYGMTWKVGLFIGFLAALSSSALVLKLLQERSELTSNYGRTVLGILIFQDLLLVPLLLMSNILADNSLDIPHEILILTLKAVFIIGIVYAGNKWLLPWLLKLIAHTRNQELFMMSIILLCFGIALLTSKLGMSIAFGAFLAGLMISESEYSHNVFGNFITIKDIFASFFFVSIGMLLDLSFISDNYLLVIISVAMVLIIKAVIAAGTGFVLGHTIQGIIMTGLALSQVGEFSFVLARIGFETTVISDFHYHLFLSVAVTTMALTPFIFKFAPLASKAILRLPLPDFLITGLFPLKEIELPDYSNHLVIIGKDASALKLSDMARMNDIRHISIIFDPILARERMNEGELVVYGDAVNEPILRKAHVDTADIVVVSVGSLIPSMAIIENVRHLNRSVYIIARATLTRNVEQLYRVGADQVIPEKLEIAIDLLNRILVKKLIPQREINRIVSHYRNMTLGEFSSKDTFSQSSFLDEFPNINISAIRIEPGSQVEGKSIIEINMRKNAGVTILAVKRGSRIIEHPLPEMVLLGGDIAYLLGNPEQINQASEMLQFKSPE